MDPEIEQSYVLLHATWPVDLARRVRQTDPSADHVIVHSSDASGERYVLFQLADADQILDAAPGDRSVAEAFDLAGTEPTPVARLHATAADAGPAVVLDEGRLIGFIRRRVVVRGPSRLRRPTPTHAAPGETTRSVDVDFPESVQAGTLESLLVLIAVEAPSATGIGIAVAAGEVVDIVVQPRKGFELEGPGEGSLTVPESGETLPLQFKLRGVDPGEGRITVLAFHRGQPLGAVDLRPTVSAAATAAEPAAPKPSRAHRKANLASSVAAVPDLSLLVEERSYGDQIEYLLRLTAPELDLNLKPFGPLKLRAAPEQFFDEFFSDIEGLPSDGADAQATARAKLEAKGAYLFDTLFPDDLKEVLWAARKRITSVIVQSEEPWIPWELCRLHGTDGDGRTVDGPFLAEAYTITRWMPGIPLKRKLSLKEIALVVPDDSGLPLAGSERDYLLSLASAGRRVTRIPATYADVHAALAAGQYDGWHFTGHGAARTNSSDRASIYLQAEQVLTPLDLSGTAANLGLSSPVVFLNACQVGRGGMSLTGIGGWARRFLEAGAGAFIGTYWSVYDTAAYEFAKAVYGELLKGTSIGKSVVSARLAIRDQGDPTWMAYTVFGDPSASVAT
jgi:hypothetical protein